MISQSNMPQPLSTLFSAYASLAASIMLVRSMANDLVPYELRCYLSYAIHYLFKPLLSSTYTLTLVIDEFSGMYRNLIYDAAEIYLRTKITVPSNISKLRVSKTSKQRAFSVTIDKGEEVKDVYENITLNWRYVCIEPKNNNSGEICFFELSFNNKFKEKVIESYLPYIMARAKAIKEEDDVVKIYSRNCPYNYNAEDGNSSGGGVWGCMNLEHPATFETLAMDSALKKMIIDDLDRFLKRKEFYKKVGKAWKRGYLLYGPPGTGKSSLVAAMANHLKFDIYDLELTTIYSDSELRRILLSTTNRSILVIEDIDCNLEVQDRQIQNQFATNKKLTLSGVLNFIDGLWSSCGDERIIVLTTNHKDRIDSALLRPGRMDVHINMSYCNTEAFNILVSNYHGINVKNHPLYSEIEGLIERGINMTPAEVAEELMRSEDTNVALEGVLKSLKRKICEANEVKEDDNGGDRESDKTFEEQVQENNDGSVSRSNKRVKT